MIRGEIIESELEAVSDISQFNREEIDMQIATAHRFPRSLTSFRQDVREMACLDEETAGSMFYVLPRGGKKIEGPSARFAEVIGAAYGNLRYGARIVAVEDKFIVAEGVCFDVQKNVSATVHVRRRITDSNNRRYNDDMIQTTGNAACSIALRNAIFKVVPMGLVKDIYEEAKLTSVGKATSMQSKRQWAIDWFAKVGVPEAKVLESLGKKGLDDVSVDDLIELRGLINAIKEGDATIEDLFEGLATKRGVVNKTSLDAEIETAKKAPAKNAKPAKAQEPQAPAPEPAPSATFEQSARVRTQYLEQLKTTTRAGALKSLLKDANEDELLSETDRLVVTTEIQDRIDVVEQ